MEAVNLRRYTLLSLFLPGCCRRRCHKRRRSGRMVQPAKPESPTPRLGGSLHRWLRRASQSDPSTQTHNNTWKMMVFWENPVFVHQTVAVYTALILSRYILHAEYGQSVSMGQSRQRSAAPVGLKRYRQQSILPFFISPLFDKGIKKINQTPCFLSWRGWGIQMTTLSDTCRWTTATGVHLGQCQWWHLLPLPFFDSLLFTCELQPSDGSGQCRGTTWPKERRRSRPHSSSFHGQMNEQSGKSPPAEGHTVGQQKEFK